MMAATSQNGPQKGRGKERDAGVIGMNPVGVTAEKLQELKYTDAQLPSEQTKRTANENAMINNLKEMFPDHAIETIEETLEKSQWNINAASAQLAETAVEESQWHTTGGKKKKEKKTQQETRISERPHRPKPQEESDKAKNTAMPREQNSNGRPKEDRRERTQPRPKPAVDLTFDSYTPPATTSGKGKAKAGSESTGPSWADIAKPKQQPPKELPAAEPVMTTYVPAAAPQEEKKEPEHIAPVPTEVPVPVSEPIIEPVVEIMATHVPEPVIEEPVAAPAPVQQQKPKPKFTQEQPLVIKFQPSTAEQPKVKFGFTAPKEKPAPAPVAASAPVAAPVAAAPVQHMPMPETQPKVQEPVVSRPAVPQALMHFTNQQQFAQAAPGPVSPPTAFPKGLGGLPQPAPPAQAGYPDAMTYGGNYERTPEYGTQQPEFAGNQQRMAQATATAQPQGQVQQSMQYPYDQVYYPGYPTYMDYYAAPSMLQHQDYTNQQQNTWPAVAPQTRQNYAAAGYQSQIPQREPGQQQGRMPAPAAGQMQAQHAYGQHAQVSNQYYAQQRHMMGYPTAPGPAHYGANSNPWYQPQQ